MLIITVHGTNDGVSTAADRKWWDPASDFAIELTERLQVLGQGHPAVSPFLWSGANVARDRSRAGKDLYARLQKEKAEGHDVVLVGHSHGGSVIDHALEEASRHGDPLHHVKKVVTVGTPFLDTRPASFMGWFTTRSLASVWPVLFWLGVLVLSVFWTEQRADFSGETPGTIFEPFLITFASAWILLLLEFSWRSRARFLRQKNYRQDFLDRCERIFSVNDEAIAGLMGLKRTSFSFVSKYVAGGLALVAALLAFAGTITWVGFIEPEALERRISAEDGTRNDFLKLNPKELLKAVKGEQLGQKALEDMFAKVFERSTRDALTELANDTQDRGLAEKNKEKLDKAIDNTKAEAIDFYWSEYSKRIKFSDFRISSKEGCLKRNQLRDAIKERAGEKKKSGDSFDVKAIAGGVGDALKGCAYVQWNDRSRRAFDSLADDAREESLYPKETEHPKDSEAKRSVPLMIAPKGSDAQDKLLRQVWYGAIDGFVERLLSCTTLQAPVEDRRLWRRDRYDVGNIYKGNPSNRANKVDGAAIDNLNDLEKLVTGILSKCEIEISSIAAKPPMDERGQRVGNKDFFQFFEPDVPEVPDVLVEYQKDTCTDGLRASRAEICFGTVQVTATQGDPETTYEAQIQISGDADSIGEFASSMVPIFQKLPTFSQSTEGWVKLGGGDWAYLVAAPTEGEVTLFLCQLNRETGLISTETCQAEYKDRDAPGANNAIDSPETICNRAWLGIGADTNASASQARPGISRQSYLDAVRGFRNGLSNPIGTMGLDSSRTSGGARETDDADLVKCTDAYLGTNASLSDKKSVEIAPGSSGVGVSPVVDPQRQIFLTSAWTYVEELLGSLFVNFTGLMIFLIGPTIVAAGAFAVSWLAMRAPTRAAVASVARTHGFGATRGEAVRRVGYTPVADDRPWQPLPEPIDTVLEANANKHASEALEHLRRAAIGERIACAVEGKEPAGLGEGSYKELLFHGVNWQSLVHCGYFVNERVAQLIAAALIERNDALEPSLYFRNTSGFQQALRDLAAIRAESEPALAPTIPENDTVLPVLERVDRLRWA